MYFFNYLFFIFIFICFFIFPAINDALVRTSFTSEYRSPVRIGASFTTDMRSPMKRSFLMSDLNSAVHVVNNLPFLQKSAIKSKPTNQNGHTIKRVISGCKLVEDVMAGE